MNDTDQRKLIESLIANLVGRQAFHIEGSVTRCVTVEEVETTNSELTLTCRPVSIPGLPTADEAPFVLAATWPTLSTTAESIFAYFSSWRLIIDEPTAAKAKALVANCSNTVEAQAAVRSLAT